MNYAQDWGYTSEVSFFLSDFNNVLFANNISHFSKLLYTIETDIVKLLGAFLQLFI